MSLKSKKLRFILLLGVAICSLVLVSFTNSELVSADKSKGAKPKPNYALVFNQEQPMRIDIKISRSEWSKMQNELDTLFKNQAHMPMGAPGMMPPPHEHALNKPPHPFTGKQSKRKMNDKPAPPQHGAGMKKVNPSWVECTVSFNGDEWKHVGIRCKGNSSLMAAHSSPAKKFSYKLDFDKFEDDYPATKNQHCYGFKQLNLNNNFKDGSLMREKVAADLFRKFGIAAPKTSFCLLYINTGNGPEFKGVYTLLEEVDDSLLKTQFTDKGGNLYKPDGPAATFANGTFNTAQMNIKTNKKKADFKDVEQLYQVINSDERMSNTALWQEQLENIFDVDTFLKWLAANSIMQNWDTYGQSAHNYYLYNNPQSGLLTWIPWDNNEALQSVHRTGSSNLSMNQVDNNWPLIRYIINVPKYKAKYEGYLKAFIDDVFIPSEIIALYDNYYHLLKDYAHAEQANKDLLMDNMSFANSIENLKKHVQNRNKAVNSYLIKK